MSTVEAASQRRYDDSYKTGLTGPSEQELATMVRLLIACLAHPSVQVVSEKHLAHCKLIMGQANEMLTGATP